MCSALVLQQHAVGTAPIGMHFAMPIAMPREVQKTEDRSPAGVQVLRKSLSPSLSVSLSLMGITSL